MLAIALEHDNSLDKHEDVQDHKDSEVPDVELVNRVKDLVPEGKENDAHYEEHRTEHLEDYMHRVETCCLYF